MCASDQDVSRYSFALRESAGYRHVRRAFKKGECLQMYGAVSGIRTWSPAGEGREKRRTKICETRAKHVHRVSLEFGCQKERKRER
jgi:hypothetical protein